MSHLLRPLGSPLIFKLRWQCCFFFPRENSSIQRKTPINLSRDDPPTSSCTLPPIRKVKVLVAEWRPTLCDPMDCSPSGSSVHEILQARILEWVTVPFSRGSSRPKDRTWFSCIALNLMMIILIRSRKREETEIHKKATWRWKQGQEFCSPKAKNTKGCREAKREAWEGFSLRTSRGNRLCQCLDF